MSTSYNSRLIDKLYQENDALKATRIVDEMIEIGEAIFVYPIYSAYKKFKNTSYSHYFISDLTELASKEETKKEAEIIIKELLEEQDIDSAHIYYLVEFCIKNKYNVANFQRQAEI
ncbi:MAG: hypothetical protein PHD23_10800, partial [Eubacteriales bacterium]|nr:hypothetical protein [Eubacteriales bacterium]